MQDPEELLGQARELYGQRRYAESGEAFARLVGFPAFAAEGHYGLGVIGLVAGTLPEAQQQLIRCIELNGSHGNAYYQLGAIAQRLGDTRNAAGWYENALAVHPGHAGAAEALSKLREPVAPPAGRPTSQSAPSPAPPSSQIGTPEQNGVYQYLNEDSSQLSRQTLEILDKLRIRRMPYVSAYLGGILKRIAIYIAVAIVVWTAGGAVTDALSSTLGSSALSGVDVTGVAFGVASAVCIAELIVYLLRIVTTRYTLERGRLQIETGILFRKLTNLELWRIQNIELHRSLIQRLTRDGTLVIEVLQSAPTSKNKDSEQGPMRVVGIARGDGLRELYHELLNLVWLLRGNSWVKGIIY